MADLDSDNDDIDLVINQIIMNTIKADGDVGCKSVKGFSTLQKCASAIRQLAYASASDAFDEYLRMSETMSRECLDQFCKGIIYLYMRQYLRKPTATDVQAIYALHEQTHGLPGMLGSIDCMHWYGRIVPWHGGVNSIEVIILDRRCNGILINNYSNQTIDDASATRTLDDHTSLNIPKDGFSKFFFLHFGTHCYGLSKTETSLDLFLV
ncbi:hypothetical protein OSB04_004682 [Centaurea solstitialis]|uniref:Nuclease HARBI1 n=1 Tax=Centaurea solstitialis TaxID=347529 RepID=A0AA38WFN9_9ASTR|nr:hypothetical protein OSB04_004682 [Centaurea solstitialis]